MVGHADAVRLGPQLAVVERDDGGNGAAQDPETGARGPVVAPAARVGPRQQRDQRRHEQQVTQLRGEGQGDQVGRNIDIWPIFYYKHFTYLS